MPTVEKYVPTTSVEANMFVDLQTALAQLGVVRALLRGDGWEQFPFDKDNWPRPSARIDRTTTLYISEIESPNSGLFVVHRDIGAGSAHEVSAYSTGYQSVRIYRGSEFGGNFVADPLELLEGDHSYEFGCFKNGASSAFKFVTDNL